MAYRYVSPVPQYFTNNGVALVNGTLTFYETGTLALKYTYPTAADAEAGTNPNTNPILLNSLGAPSEDIWLDGDYRVIAKNAGGVTQWDRDPIVQSQPGDAILSVATTAALRALAKPTTDQSVVTRGFSANGDGGGATWIWDALSSATDNTGTIVNPTGNGGAGRWKRVFAGPVHSKWFGCAIDGVTNDSTPLQGFFDYCGTNGVDGVLDPGTYLTSSQVTFTPTALKNICIFGFGAELTTSGAISALKVSGGDQAHSREIHGVTVNHRGNASATAGFELVGASKTRLLGCSVEAHGTGAGYAAYWLHNTTPADANTGCFWCVIMRCGTRKRSGGDAGNMAYGVKLQGAANATAIMQCSFISCDVAVGFVNESGQTYCANGVVIDGNWMEGCTTGIESNIAATSTLSGCRITNNRAESLTTFFSMVGQTTLPAVPTWLSGNYMISSVTNYINNPNSLYVNCWDFSITPNLNVGPHLQLSDGITWHLNSGVAQDTLTAYCGSVGYGIRLLNNVGGDIGGWEWDTSTGTRLTGINAMYSGPEATAPVLRWGAGTPEGVVTAPVGSLFLRTNGGASTTAYIKESGTGATGWVSK